MNENKQPIKMIPGDELHLTMLMAPFNLNFFTGQDRQHLLAYGRAAFEAGKKTAVAGQCLHQIQEPSAAEQAAWQAGLDEGRAQAAITAMTVVLPDPVAYRHLLDSTEGITGNQQEVQFSETRQNPFGTPGVDHDESFPYVAEALFTEQQVRALLAGVSAPAAQSTGDDDE